MPGLLLVAMGPQLWHPVLGLLPAPRERTAVAGGPQPLDDGIGPITGHAEDVKREGEQAEGELALGHDRDADARRARARPPRARCAARTAVWTFGLSWRASSRIRRVRKLSGVATTSSLRPRGAGSSPGRRAWWRRRRRWPRRCSRSSSTRRRSCSIATIGRPWSEQALADDAADAAVADDHRVTAGAGRVVGGSGHRQVVAAALEPGDEVGPAAEPGAERAPGQGTSAG